MCDNNLKCSNDAVEKIIGNMTAEMQNSDGQYVPLGFTPPPPVNSETLNWGQASNSYMNHYNVCYPEPHMAHPQMEQYQGPQIPFPSQTSQFFDPIYSKNLPEFDNFTPIQNNAPDLLYNNYLSPNMMSDAVSPPNPPHAHIIENLVGNWMIPNNSGTYSPFGNTDTFKPNVFDLQNHEESKFKQGIDSNVEENHFNFNRGVRKPRMVAEVKPMRPSYSDVLTKPVPPNTTTKPLKNENKDSKPKKDNKKNVKNERHAKPNGLNRSNTNNDIKDLPADRVIQKDRKTNKTNRLNRKWASLDNISEPANASKIPDEKKKKCEENVNRQCNRQNKNKINKTVDDIVDLEPENIRTEMFNATKSSKKSKVACRLKHNDSSVGLERTSNKRNQRSKKRENSMSFGTVGLKITQYLKGWWNICASFLLWLFNLISDICCLSIHISRDLATNSWSWLCINWVLFVESVTLVLERIKFFTWIWEKFKGKKSNRNDEEKQSFSQGGLENNINMPTTGDEAMKRLLACKGKDPYSILGVTPGCTDDDIKKYYKRQAFLVHPDKNNQPGAEEAFKILVHAFDMIGTAERRASYDRGVVESAQVVQAWTELTELLQQLQQKVEAAATTIRCSACGSRHKRTKIDRPSYAARNCTSCKIHHSAREGDIWAEARCFGFLWHYYACMEGAVYDITDWAGCQKESLKYLKPDSHHVQYRIALGKQNSQPRRNSASPRGERPDLENLLNSLYGQGESSGTKRRNKNRK